MSTAYQIVAQDEVDHFVPERKSDCPGTIPTPQICLNELDKYAKGMSDVKWMADSIAATVRFTNSTYLKDAKDYPDFLQKISVDYPSIKTAAAKLFEQNFTGYTISNLTKTNDAKSVWVIANYPFNSKFSSYFALKSNSILKNESSYFATYTEYFKQKTTAKMKMIVQAKSDWESFVSSKFMEYLGKSEDQMSAAKTFYQDLNNLVKIHQPDTTIAYGKRLLVVLDYYNPTDAGAIALKSYLRTALFAENDLADAKERVYAKANAVKQSEVNVVQTFTGFSPKLVGDIQQAKDNCNVINQSEPSRNAMSVFLNADIENVKTQGAQLQSTPFSVT